MDEPRNLAEYLEQQGRLKAGDPSAWLSEAESLQAAGDAVWDESQRLSAELFATPFHDLDRKTELLSNPRMWTWSVSMMLWAFALENLLKGLMVAADEGLIRLEGMAVRFPWSAKQGHDLVWLADQAGVELNETLVALVGRLSAVARWGGRYPLPLDLREMMSEKVEDGERGGPTYITGEEIAALHDLYNELHERLSAASGEISERRRLAQEAEHQARRPEVMADLRARCQSHTSDNGTTIFTSDETPPTDERTAVACAPCRTNVTLGREVVGAICPCGNLYVTGYRYDPAFDRKAIYTVRYPPTE